MIYYFTGSKKFIFTIAKNFELPKVSKLKTPDFSGGCPNWYFDPLPDWLSVLSIWISLSEKSLIYPSSWRNKKLKWEIGDPLECSDCGHHPGDIRQYAACYFKNSAGDLQPCDHRYMMNQVMVKKCHIPCRPKVSYLTPSCGWNWYLD